MNDAAPRRVVVVDNGTGAHAAADNAGRLLRMWALFARSGALAAASTLRSKRGRPGSGAQRRARDWREARA